MGVPSCIQYAADADFACEVKFKCTICHLTTTFNLSYLVLFNLHLDLDDDMMRAIHAVKIVLSDDNLQAAYDVNKKIAAIDMDGYGEINESLRV